jgi:hypothetical protein
MEVRKMKNIQVIDGANNCTYPIYSATEDEFLVLFPECGQDIEFIEDAIERVGREDLGSMMTNVWKRPVKKPDVVGIHGTLFYELLWKKKYYPSKKDSEMVGPFSKGTS